MKFCAGDFSLDKVPRSGRPVEIDSNQIKTLIENNQRYTMWEIADILSISKSIKRLMKMKIVSYFTEKNIWIFLANPIESRTLLCLTSAGNMCTQWLKLFNALCMLLSTGDRESAVRVTFGMINTCEQAGEFANTDYEQ